MPLLWLPFFVHREIGFACAAIGAKGGGKPKGGPKGQGISVYLGIVPLVWFRECVDIIQRVGSVYSLPAEML